MDVLTQVEIRRPPSEVAAFASDPDNATAWYTNIESVEWETTKPLVVGSRMAFVAHFLGRRLAYVYEVKELSPSRLMMATSEGPFPMETTYEWKDAGQGATLMTLRNRGLPVGFRRALAPVLALAVGRANRKDLARLKAILEG